MSEPNLALRWKWSRTKLRNFLKCLEKEQQIIQQKDNITQVLTIVNYEEYQKKEQQTGQQKNSRRTAERQQKDVNNNDNNENNANNDNKIPPIVPQGGNSEPPKTEKKTWRNDYETYKQSLRDARDRLLADSSWVESMESLYSNVDVSGSLNAALHNYWGLESTWLDIARRRKGKTVLMHEWLKKGFSKNRIYNRLEK